MNLVLRGLSLVNLLEVFTIAQVTAKEDLPPHILAPKVHWERASGYFALEMYEEAERELRALPKEEPWSKNAKILLLGIRQEQENWALMQKIAADLRRESPSEGDWWISEAFATRRCDSIEAAREILLEGLGIHPGNALIRYNLACYACLLNSPDECLNLLKEAVKMDENFKAMALEDEDLEQVRDALIEWGWDRVVA